MRWRTLAVPLALVGPAVLLLVPRPAVPQDPPPPPDKFEVLARGPVHEAYATPVEYQPEAGPIADKAPPEPIDELPPDQKPEGDDVEWIPGYWAWENEDKDFLWVSGFWRDMPPDRRWVPGTWQEAADGWHWTPGFWAPEAAETIEYSPPPPRNIDAGPSTPAVRETDVYTPGCWIWHESRFYWRPGFWVEYRPDWVWVPAQYSWTPGGCVFVEGYWDHPLHLRGMLFAPIRPRAEVVAFTYRPAYVIQTDFLLSAMFVGPARRHYHFGDYFEERYEKSGYVAWMNYQPTRRVPDPVFSYYRATYRTQPAWSESLTTLYAARRSGEVARPPRTLVQQNTVVNNITNNKTTNVNVVKNINITNVQNVTVIRPITQVNNTQVTALASLTPAAPKAEATPAPRNVIKMTQVNNTQVNQQKVRIEQTRALSKQRQQTEAKLIAEPPAKGTAERPRPTARLELPKPTAPAVGTKKDDPGTPATPPRAKSKAPAPPPIPKHVERAAPKEDRDPPPPIRPPTGTRKDPPAKTKDVPRPKKDKDDDPVPPKKGPMPKKDKDDDPVPPKKVPVPKKDKDDDPVPPKKAPVPKKDKDDDPPPKKGPMPKMKDDPVPPKKADPAPIPPKKDKDDDPVPPKKTPKKDKD
jgi:WXXGXW repeat (2 copies)